MSFHVRKLSAGEGFGRMAEIHGSREDAARNMPPLVSMNRAKGPWEGHVWFQAGAMSVAVADVLAKDPTVVVSRRGDLQMRVGPVLEMDMDDQRFLAAYREAVSYIFGDPEVQGKEGAPCICRADFCVFGCRACDNLGKRCPKEATA